MSLLKLNAYLIYHIGLSPPLCFWWLRTLLKYSCISPYFFRVSRVPSPGGTGTNTSSPVLAFSAHENLNLLAFGFENGCVILQRGDVTRERGVKTKILMEGDAPITGRIPEAWNLNIKKIANSTFTASSPQVSASRSPTSASISTHPRCLGASCLTWRSKTRRPSQTWTPWAVRWAWLLPLKTPPTHTSSRVG